MTNEQMNIVKLIELKNFDKQLYSVILDYCMSYLSRDFKTEGEKKRSKTALNKVINFLPNQVQKYNWENYCVIMNNIQEDKKIDRKKVVCIPLSEIYCEVITKIEELHFLKPYLKYFIVAERINNGTLLIDKYYIGTNFPLSSALDSLALIEYPSRGKEGLMNKTIVNLHSSNSFLNQLLTGYLKSINPMKSTCLIYRQFIYFFSSSLNKGIKSITDFDFKSFKYQYRFYKRIGRISKQDENAYLKILINFYAYLFDMFYQETGRHDFFYESLIDKNILTSLKFSFAYENGYTFVEIPGLIQKRETNRIAVIKNDSKANIRSNNLSYYDFGIIDSDIYREDVKSYFWDNNSLNTTSFSGRFKYIVDFLNLKTEFDSIVSNQSQIDNSKFIEIQPSFIYHYVSYVRNKYTDSGTIRHVFKAVRGFLEFHAKKYKISKLMFNLLNEKIKTYDGGIVIDEHDLNLIFNCFKNKRNDSIRAELFYIIFVLCVTTKLRLGEVLNLKINYKVNQLTDSDVVIIKYYKKTSKLELVTTELSAAKSLLLDRAIELTQEYRNKATHELGENIFIMESKTYKRRMLKLTSQFQNYFTEVIEELKDEIKQKYTAYNLRSTFIDNVYTKGIEQNLSLLTLEEMTGNSSNIALRHYVKKKDLYDYAEIFSGVQLNNREIIGEVLKDDGIIEEYSPVEDNLGVCRSNSCNNEMIYEEDTFVCLKCNKFVTSISRIPYFEKKMNQLKRERAECTDKYEITFIDKLLELYGAYYSKLIELINDEKKG